MPSSPPVENETVRPRAPVVLFGVLCVYLATVGLSSVLHPALASHSGRAAVAFALAAVVAFVPGLGWLRSGVQRFVFGSRARVFDAAVFALGVAGYAVLAHRLFQAMPHMDDSIAAIFQAKVLLAGHITLAVPDLHPFFALFGVLSAGNGVHHWCGMYPPGWPVLLMPGVALGAAWLTNSVLGGLLAVMTGKLATALFAPRVGRVAALLCLLSPFIGVQGASHLSHVPTGLGVVTAWWAVMRLLETGMTRYGVVAGAALGGAFLCRPVTTVLLGVIIGVGVCVRWRAALVAWRAVFAAVAIVLLCGGALAAWQHETTGDFRTAGHVVGMGERGRVGFGPFDESLHHTPARGLQHTKFRFAHQNQHLLGWPVAAALFVMMPFLLGRARWREAWLLLPVVVLAAFYLCFWYFEEYYPGRYLFAGLPMLLILVARGWDLLRQRAATRGARIATVPSAVYGACVLFAMLVGAPAYHERIGGVYGDVENLLPGIVEDYGISNAIVFMESVGEKRDGRKDVHNSYFGTGFMRNALTLDGDVLYARNAQQFESSKLENSDLMRKHPDRRFYFYRFDRGQLRAYLYEIGFDGESATRIVPIRPIDGDERLLYDPVVHRARS